MKMERFELNDIPDFLNFAASEGWLSSDWELRFLLNSFPQGCFSFRAGGLPIAFVTSMKYNDSGWIGNLIVRESMRGKGIGSSLMKRALDALQQAGVRTVWLTASTSGKPIYERLGFVELDVINRWKGKGYAGHFCQTGGISLGEALVLDSMGWGDSREALLSATFKRGEIFGGPGGFLVIQGDSVLMQAGPWGCINPQKASMLLDAAMAKIAGTGEIVLDVPGKNAAAASLLASRGFGIAGRTSLMYRGTAPLYKPEIIYGLGSMGSMG